MKTPEKPKEGSHAGSAGSSEKAKSAVTAPPGTQRVRRELNEEEQLSIMIRSGYQLIYLHTSEEQRALRTLRGVAQENKLGFYSWTSSSGLQTKDDRGETRTQPMDESMVLDKIIPLKDQAIVVLLDYHPYMAKGGRQAEIVRKLRDVVAAFRRTNRTLVILSPVLELPVELEKDFTLFEYALPTAEQLREVLDQLDEQARALGKNVDLNEDDKERMVKAMQGLTETQAENALAKALVTYDQLSVRDIEIIHREKEQIIRKSGILEFYSSPESLQGVGGLDTLKEWFRKRKDAFTDRARAFGLPAPKGILLLGVPGCGKSLSAKALAAEWDKPLLRLDVGRIFGSLVGKSEENMRMAIQVAESVAPAILWIDEIEKGFAGMRGGGDGAGVVARVFGTMITWMQEKTAPVFVIATANDISQLPPEMLRKGRFDEIFFVDLPFPEEREAIFKIHLSKRGRKPDEFDLATFVDKTDLFSGAEIEQIIISALTEAFDCGSSLTSQHILESIRETHPLSETMSDHIEALRGWAQTRARIASSQRRSPAKGYTYEEEHDSFRLILPKRD